MGCIFGLFCLETGCAGGGPRNVGCESLGLHDCESCAIGSFAAPLGDELNENALPAGHVLGHIVQGLGWVIKKSLDSRLQANDIVMDVNGKRVDNAGWFLAHSLQHAAKRFPAQFVIRFHRPGELPSVQTVTIAPLMP